MARLPMAIEVKVIGATLAGILLDRIRLLVRLREEGDMEHISSAELDAELLRAFDDGELGVMIADVNL